MAIDRFTISLNVADVETTNVAVSVPIPDYSVLERFALFSETALVTVPTLGILDTPASLLRRIFWNRLLPAGSNLDFLVRLSTGGPTDLTGLITGYAFDGDVGASGIGGDGSLLYFGAFTDQFAADDFLRPWQHESNAGIATENQNQLLIPASGVVDRLVLRCTTGNVAATRGVTVRLNGVDTALTAAIAGSAALAVNATNSFVVAQGDLVSCQLDDSLAAGDLILASLRYRPY